MGQTGNLDPSKLRLSSDDIARLSQPSRKPKLIGSINTYPIPHHRSGERFLRALIPWNWLEAAATLPDSALLIGLVLWQRVGALRSQPFKLSTKSEDFGVSRRTAQRAIHALEKAGLIKVWRQAGHSLEIALLDVPTVSTTEQEKCNRKSSM